MADLTSILLLSGRLLFGGYFLHAAWGHVVHGQALVGYARMKGVPAASAAVYGTGVLLLLGGGSVLLGLVPRVGLALLAVFLLGVTPMMHAFWKETDAMARTMERVQFLKNTALLGAVAALVALPTPWPWALA